MTNITPLLFAQSTPGRRGVRLAPPVRPGATPADLLPDALLRKTAPNLPELSEVEVVRHFTALSRKNYGLDDGFYPLGSCTMKHNPRINEQMARLPAWTNLHPEQPDETVQGALALLFDLQNNLSDITGMDAYSLLPAAGAHGELAGLLMLKAYHRHNENPERDLVLIPDSAHGTNPASAAMAGFRVVEIPSTASGTVNLESLRTLLTGEEGSRVAGLMLTNPNTLGLFETDILEISELVHQAGGLLYYDGANLNAIMGTVRPGDMGFDLIHLNLHKTFGTPHGGGGPGAGPVGAKAFLAPFLPSPVVARTDNPTPTYVRRSAGPLSIGRIREFQGNFGVLVRAYAYILSLGAEGITAASRIAVLNAQYLKYKIGALFDDSGSEDCMHEFVLSGENTKARKSAAGSDITTLDIAKRLLDYGYHPPTIYFPLIVREAMMFEPTETETREDLDAFADVMKMVLQEAIDQPGVLKSAPHTTPVRRLDEVTAARSPLLRWVPGEDT